MAWSFRKRVKIIPGVHLNFSKRGISTSIGVRGASLNFSSSGTRLNTSIPGLGLYNTQKLSGGLGSNSTPRADSSNIPQLPYNPIKVDNIISADIHEITSQNMQGIKESILLAHKQRDELKSDILKVKSDLKSTRLKLLLGKLFLYGFVFKSMSNVLKVDIETQNQTVNELKSRLEKCYVNLEIEFDSEIGDKYNALSNAFKKLTYSEKIWDVTSAHSQDTRITRSSAATIVSKREVKFGMSHIPDIKSPIEPFLFRNANGADLYFYPNFIVMYSSSTQFAVIGLDEIRFHSTYVRFTETGTIPTDSKVIDNTWYKVNKNGTPDKRFKGNYQIPVVRYGEINLKTSTGLHEEYEFSNYESCAEFSLLFNEYQALIASLKAVTT